RSSAIATAGTRRWPWCPKTRPRTGARTLPGLAVDGVVATPPAVLLQLEPVAIVHLVLLGDVVPPLAVVASERDGGSVVGLRPGADPSERVLRHDSGGPARRPGLLTSGSW